MDRNGGAIKVKKFCNLMIFIKQENPKLYDIIDGLCLQGLFSTRYAVTFLNPDAKLTKAIEDKATSDNPEKAIEMVKGLLLKGFYPSKTSIESATDISNYNGKTIDAKTKGISLKESSKFKPTERKRDSLSVFDCNMIPSAEKMSNWKPPPRGQKKKGGMVAGDTNTAKLSNRMLKYKAGQCLPVYAGAVIELYNNVSKGGKATIAGLMDQNPAVTYNLAFNGGQPGISDSDIDGAAESYLARISAGVGGSSQDVQEYVGLYENLSDNPKVSGAMAAKKDIISSGTFSRGGQFPTAVIGMYEKLHGKAGGKKLHDDSVRFQFAKAGVEGGDVTTKELHDYVAAGETFSLVNGGMWGNFIGGSEYVYGLGEFLLSAVTGAGTVGKGQQANLKKLAKAGKVKSDFGGNVKNLKTIYYAGALESLKTSRVSGGASRLGVRGASAIMGGLTADQQQAVLDTLGISGSVAGSVRGQGDLSSLEHVA